MEGVREGESERRKAIVSRDTVTKLIVRPDGLLDKISSIIIRKAI